MFRTVLPRLADMKSGDTYPYSKKLFVYHVINLYNGNRIIATGFRLPEHANARRELLGRGVYASYDIRKALQYVKDNDGHHYVVLKCTIADGLRIVVVNAGDALSRTWHEKNDGAVCFKGANGTNLNEIVLKDPTKLVVVEAWFVDSRRAYEDGWQQQAGPSYFSEYKPEAAFVALLCSGGAGGAPAGAPAAGAPAAAPFADLLADMALFSSFLKAPEVALFLNCSGVVDWDCVRFKMTPSRVPPMRAHAIKQGIVIDEICMRELTNFRAKRMASIAAGKRTQKAVAAGSPRTQKDHKRPRSPSHGSAAATGKRAAACSPAAGGSARSWSGIRSPSPTALIPVSPRSPPPSPYGGATFRAAVRSQSPVLLGSRAAGGSARSWSPGIRSPSPPHAPRSRSASSDVQHEIKWRMNRLNPYYLVSCNNSSMADLLDKFPEYSDGCVESARNRKRAAWEAL